MAKKINTENPILSSTQIQQKSVSDFLNTEVKTYAKYVIESRALPNIMDGLRTGARKLVYAALTTPEFKQGKKVKMLTYLGRAMALQYKHGNTSIENTAKQLSLLHTLNTCPLEVMGQIGTLRVPKCDTAPRYLHVKAGKYLEMFRTDIELTKEQLDEGEKIEPAFFLPIIPVCMMQRMSNPGFGFSFKGFSFDTQNVIAAVMQVLLNGTCNGIERIELKPYIYGIKPENIIWNEKQQAWYNVGEYELDFANDMLRVTDLPYNMSFEKFEELLFQLKEQYYIRDFDNHSIENRIDYRIYFHQKRLKNIYNSAKWKFFSKLKLFTKIPKLNLNCIDEDGVKILYFETPNELIDAFVERRLKYYTLRKSYTIDLLEKRNKLLDERILFIQLVVDGKLVVAKRAVKDIKVDLDKYGISTDVLKLPIARLTKDEIDKAKKERDENQKELNYIKRTSEKHMYINDLIEFENTYLGITDMRNQN